MQRPYTNDEMLEMVDFANSVFVYAKVNSFAPVAFSVSKTDVRRALASNVGCDWYVDSNANGNLYLGTK